MARSEMDRVGLMRALFPSLAAKVDAAYLPFAGEQPGVGFDNWLDTQVNAVLPGPASLIIADGELADRFDRAFVAARSAASLLGVELPEIEAFVAAGANLGRLVEALAADPSLTPVAAPYGLGSARWIEAFDSFDSPGQPKLVIAADATREFVLLDEVPQPAPATVQAVSGAGVGAGASFMVRWTLRLIPAAPGPSVLGLSFAHGPHVSLPEILMLQLMRATNGQPLLDATSFTWLAGSLAQGRLAARHVYDATGNTIRITCREVANQGPHLGARPPIG